MARGNKSHRKNTRVRGRQLVRQTTRLTAAHRSRALLRAPSLSQEQLEDALLDVLGRGYEEKLRNFFDVLADGRIPVERRVELVKVGAHWCLWDHAAGQKLLSTFLVEHKEADEAIVAELFNLSSPWEDWDSRVIARGLESVVENHAYSPELRRRVYGWLWQDVFLGDSGHRSGSGIRWMLDAARSESLGGVEIVECVGAWLPLLRSEPQVVARRRHNARPSPDDIASARACLFNRRGDPSVRWLTLLIFAKHLNRKLVEECLDDLLQEVSREPELFQAISLYLRDLHVLGPMSVCKTAADRLRSYALSASERPRLARTYFQQLTGFAPLGALYDACCLHAIDNDEVWQQILSLGDLDTDLPTAWSEKLADLTISPLCAALTCLRLSLLDTDSNDPEERAERFVKVCEPPNLNSTVCVDALALIGDRMPITTALCHARIAGIRTIAHEERRSHFDNPVMSNYYDDVRVLKECWKLAERIPEDYSENWLPLLLLKHGVRKLEPALHDAIDVVGRAVWECCEYPDDARRKADRAATFAYYRGLSDFIGADFQDWTVDRFLSYARNPNHSPGTRIIALRLLSRKDAEGDLSPDIRNRIHELAESEPDPDVRERMLGALASFASRPLASSPS